jgi:hypothetical protein
MGLGDETGGPPDGMGMDDLDDPGSGELGDLDDVD